MSNLTKVREALEIAQLGAEFRDAIARIKNPPNRYVVALSALSAHEEYVRELEEFVRDFCEANNKSPATGWTRRMKECHKRATELIAKGEQQ